MKNYKASRAEWEKHTHSKPSLAAFGSLGRIELNTALRYNFSVAPRGMDTLWLPTLSFATRLKQRLKSRNLRKG
jgi:hypothetical protein